MTRTNTRYQNECSLNYRLAEVAEQSELVGLVTLPHRCLTELYPWFHAVLAQCQGNVDLQEAFVTLMAIRSMRCGSLVKTIDHSTSINHLWPTTSSVENHVRPHHYP